MDKTPKFKIHSRHRKRNDRKSHGSATDKRLESPRDTRQSRQETPVKATGSKSIADLHSCYQFIESEPAIVWGSPHVSPSYELRAKQVCISTPQHRPKNKELFPKPTRKLVKGTKSPSQFLRGLMDLSEQLKSDKVKLKEQPDLFVDYGSSTEVPLSVEVSGTALSDSDKLLPLSPKYRPCSAEIEQIKKDSFQALFDDGDDDIMLKCSQEIEEIICKVTNAEPTAAVSEEEEIIRMCGILTPELKGAKLKCKKQGTERTPKNNKHTKTASKRVGGSSSNKDRSCVVNQPVRNTAHSHCKAIVSEKRNSPRLRNSSMRSREELLDFGCDSFEDIKKTMDVEDFPDPFDSPQRKVLESEYAYDPRSDTVEVGRRKGTPRSSRNSANNKQSANRGPSKSELLELYWFKEDLNESDLVKALDVVESQMVQSSPPFRCTPDEILQKKLEAKRRLAKKKLSRRNGSAKVSSTSLKPKR